MKTTQYLYNKEPNELPSMAEGLIARIEAAKQFLLELQELPLLERNQKQIYDVAKAIEHCTSLLEGNV